MKMMGIGGEKMTNPPFVSIIVPVYNTPKELLVSCFDSILNQTCKDWELIVTDDGSNEDCAQNIDRLLANHANITVIHKHNEGVSKARNVAVEKAAGSYLLFVDADNTLPLDALDTYAKAVDAETELIIGLSVLGDRKIENGKDIITVKEEVPFEYKEEIIADKDELINHLLTGRIKKFTFANGHFGDGPCGKLYKTEIVKSILFPANLKWSEDTIWLLDYIHAVSRIKLVNVRVYNNISYGDSATRRYRKDGIKEFLEVTESEEKIVQMFPACRKAVYAKQFTEFLFVSRVFLFNKGNAVSKQIRYRQFLDWVKTETVKTIFVNIFKYQDLSCKKNILAKIYAFFILSKAYRLCFCILKFYAWRAA